MIRQLFLELGFNQISLFTFFASMSDLVIMELQPTLTFSEDVAIIGTLHTTPSHIVITSQDSGAIILDNKGQ